LNSKTAYSNEILLYESLRPKCLHFSVPKDHDLEIKIKEKLEKLREKKSEKV